MVAITLCWWLVTLTCLDYWFRAVAATRRFDRRRDVDQVLPANASAAGWSVPLTGGLTCHGAAPCTNALSPPAPDKKLQYISLARGIYTYTCLGHGPSEVPVFQSQSTQLYNAAPVIPQLPDEAALHSLIPQLYDFDYAELTNSTLDCMGTIGTINNTAIVTLFDVATFEAHPLETVLAPNNPTTDGDWGHSASPGRSWEVYRVEVVGGVGPICGDEGLAYERDYAAEYWFFHSSGEDLWTSVDVNKTSTQPNAKGFI